MAFNIEEIETDRLPEYAVVPIAFTVESMFEVEQVRGGLGGIQLNEVEVETPYIKDYDAYEDKGPLGWPIKYDIRNWGLLLGSEASRPIAAAAIAFDTPGVNMLAGRRDLAVLWDIRVHPDCRWDGLGTEMFHRVIKWCRSKNCRQLKIETQNVNVPACRFYAKHGCHLGEFNRYAYVGHPEVAHEAMLIWYLDL